jgi:NADPH:quinone reductase-like Zn-dependent oxidoreductase
MEFLFLSFPLNRYRSEATRARYSLLTTERLNGISRLFYTGQLTPQVGTLLPLNDVRTAHEMLAGAPHKRGKIVLEISG